MLQFIIENVGPLKTGHVHTVNRFIEVDFKTDFQLETYVNIPVSWQRCCQEMAGLKQL